MQWAKEKVDKKTWAWKCELTNSKKLEIKIKQPWAVKSFQLLNLTGTNIEGFGPISKFPKRTHFLCAFWKFTESENT
ncbi:hypothetical protein P872_22965 [Rhodonellum psychrophilum GCM71 = DSM 17998]|uniref:Uncharacterized protein n=1 Tax=Rhodonellum psychrophilum GCM71 = DSM 17998 TaxID=1123057 RepID=U5C7K0_9BACT|nr:hypothetical protein P872_22965 [Rhodonellum psychrophilum GCM71 = DSM 17998]